MKERKEFGDGAYGVVNHWQDQNITEAFRVHAASWVSSLCEVQAPTLIFGLTYADFAE